MITPKKRFEVLKRDGFRCRYCGRNGENVSLEADHIIPKSKGGGDDIDNLVCCCRECNMGKGKNDVALPAKISYKTKISDTCYRLKTYFYEERNKRKMGSIDKYTTTLISFLCDSRIKGKGGLNYCGWITYPLLYGENSIYGEDWKSVDGSKMQGLFMQGGDFCDDVLEIMFREEQITIEDIINFVYNNSNRKWDSDTDYNGKLNYKITEDICDEYGYILRKYTLFPKLLTNG